jgi:putative FmdB family regulatory protein
MPIYEFECEECGARFDRLVEAGTETVSCERCGSERTVRRYSAQAATFKLVKSPGDARKQEARNAVLHKNTKDAFKARRKAAREAKARLRPSGSDG